MQLSVDLVDDLAQVFRLIDEVDLIDVDDQDVALGVAGDPVLVAAVELLEVVQAHAALIVAAAVFDVGHQGADTGAEVDKQVRRLNAAGHGMEELGVAFVVPLRHQSHTVQVGGEDVGVLVDRPVLDDGMVAVLDIDDLPVTVV